MTRERTSTHSRYANIARWAVLAVLSLLALYLVTLLYIGGRPLAGALVLGGYALGAYIYTSKRALTYRYLFPGLAGIAIFVVFPLVFTIWLGFTNYSSANILTFDRATDVLLSRTYQRGDERLEFQLHADGDGFRLVLLPEDDEDEDDTAQDEQDEQDEDSIFGSDDTDDTGDTDDADRIFADDTDADSIFADDTDDTGADTPPIDDAGTAGGRADASANEAAETPDQPGRAAITYVSERFTLDSGEPITIDAVPLPLSGFEPGEPLPIREVIERQRALERVTVRLPQGSTLVKASLRTFAAEARLYAQNPDGTLTNQQTGVTIRPNFEIGFYDTPEGEKVTPGFRVTVGFEQYGRVFTDPRFRAPFWGIFQWTVTFAALSVLFTLIVGVLLAELLDWQGLRFRGLYRVLLFLPYAVPGFISILVFRGLFNENFGEINLILDQLFGTKPAWFSDTILAKTMILIVNTWLGYPYIMLLWMGLRQSVPKDLYEASALAGAGPLINFFKITWPLLRRPLTPLLVSSFAFNFNNFVLIELLTKGRPIYPDSEVTAGETDILVSYTYRIAFESTGKEFGLAAAISTVIFLMVALLSLINLKLTKVNQTEPR
jgi:maltose/maltodextrin transport system permease protein